MNREEFMKELEYLLMDIPEEDKQDAVAYYRDYLEDAGDEHEQEVIQEFGSPERVAAIIRADLGGRLELSGGQQQRVAIGRALASERDILLADEPTGNLDGKTALEIAEIMKRMAHEYKKCVIVVTHSLEVAEYADVVFELKQARLNDRYEKSQR